MWAKVRGYSWWPAKVSYKSLFNLKSIETLLKYLSIFAGRRNSAFIKERCEGQEILCRVYWR